MGWRYQIPMLLELGFRVVAPDSVGYGKTVDQYFFIIPLPFFEHFVISRQDAPQFSEHTASEYTYKTAADDVKALAEQLGASQIILGGHDWHVTPALFPSSPSFVSSLHFPHSSS